MTNFPTDPTNIESDDDASLVADLAALYAAPVPRLRFDSAQAGSRHKPERRAGLLSRRGRLAAGVAAAAALGAIVAGSTVWRGDAEPVSAEAILDRTSAASATNAPVGVNRSYHLVATFESPRKEGYISTTEIWYQDASHVRTEDRTDQTPSDFGQIMNGGEAWWYLTMEGELRAVHFPATELSAWKSPFAPGESLADVIGQYDGGCQSARQVDDAQVLGRAAYVLVVTTHGEACGKPLPVPERSKDGEVTIWVDQETFLPLKTEARDAGELAYRYEVTQIEVGAPLDAATFTYEPPPGVTVIEAASASDAKMMLAGEPKRAGDGEAPSLPENPVEGAKPTPPAVNDTP